MSDERAYDVGGKVEAQPVQYAGRPGVRLALYMRDGTLGVEVLLDGGKAGTLIEQIVAAILAAERGEGEICDIPNVPGPGPT